MKAMAARLPGLDDGKFSSENDCRTPEQSLEGAPDLSSNCFDLWSLCLNDSLRTPSFQGSNVEAVPAQSGEMMETVQLPAPRPPQADRHCEALRKASQHCRRNTTGEKNIRSFS
jgi:hypothetical protein